MPIDSSQIGSLLGGAYTPSSSGVYGAVIGPKQDITTSVLGSVSTSNSSAITSQQSSALQGLRDFVNENVGGDEAESLLASISALESFLKNGDTNASLDPVFSLLSQNSSEFSQTDPGAFVDVIV